MSKKRKAPHGEFKSPRKPQAYISTNIPINRMGEFSEAERKAMPKPAAAAWEKENHLRNLIGPTSLPDEWYPKSVKALKPGEGSR